MLSHLNATDLRLDLDLKVGNDFALADPGSLALTVRGVDGEPLAGLDGAPLPDTVLNHVVVEIPAAANTLGAGAALAPRFVSVAFKVAGKSYSVTTTYRVIKFMPISVTPEDVRQALGISFGELPDEAVDLFQSYLLRSAKPSFVTALQSGSLPAIYANQILVYVEALRLAPSLQARILKQEEKDNALYTRFLMDFELLIAQLQAALKAAEDALDIINAEDQAAGVVIFIVSLPTDPVTAV